MLIRSTPSTVLASFQFQIDRIDSGKPLLNIAYDWAIDASDAICSERIMLIARSRWYSGWRSFGDSLFRKVKELVDTRFQIFPRFCEDWVNWFRWWLLNIAFGMSHTTDIRFLLRSRRCNSSEFYLEQVWTQFLQDCRAICCPRSFGVLWRLGRLNRFRRTAALRWNTHTVYSKREVLFRDHLEKSISDHFSHKRMTFAYNFQ